MSTSEVPKSRRRYVGASIIMECCRDTPIPIISVTVANEANRPATASVHMHPNRNLHRLTRGLNIYVISTIMEQGVDTGPVQKVMFIGDVVSIQTTTVRNNTEYIINLSDNRKYIAELPSFYLKLIRTKHDQNKGAHYRNDPGGMQSPLGDVAGGYAGANGIPSLYDEWADANFYGIGGKYQAENAYYDITDARVVAMMDKIMDKNTLAGYLKKMLEPLYAPTGWEPYYVNMNKKKRITDHLRVYDDGLYQAAIKAEFAEAAWQSIKDSHAELHTTYDDALARLSELGYLFNSNLFPSLTGGKEESLSLDDGDTIEYQIRSALLPGELIGIVRIADTDDETPVPTKSARYAINAGSGGCMYDAPSPEIFSVSKDGYTYYAIINREKDHKGGNVKASPRVEEYNVIPKMYGVLPPKCNWEIMRDGVTLNAMIGEPPITALKYNLKDGFTNVSVYTCAYPGGLEFFSLYVAPIIESTEPVLPLPTDGGGTDDGGKTYSTSIEDAIRNHVPVAHRDIVRAIIWVESGGKHHATSDFVPKKGKYKGMLMHAYGPMQVYPEAQGTEVDWARIKSYDIDYNIWAGYYVFRKYVDIYNGDVINALASYNAGSPTTKGLGYAQKVRNRYIYITGRDLPGLISVAGGRNTIPYNPAGTASAGGGAGEVIIPQPTAAQPQAPAFDLDIGTGHTDINRYMSYGHGQHHFEAENIYGIKRVSTTGSAIYELEKVTQYAEERDEANSNDLVVSRRQKFDMIKQKVKRDYYESTVSRNTGVVIVQGLAEDVMVGLPYIIYYPPHALFYYGFVMSITHRVDNSAGEAYTEIALSNLMATASINAVESAFSGYIKASYVPSGKISLKTALANLNKLYAAVAHTDNITEEDYRLFDLGVTGNAEILTKLLTSRPGHRNICTMERLQKYYYNNERSAMLHDDVVGTVCSRRQWISSAMDDTMKRVASVYGPQIKTALSYTQDYDEVEVREPVVIDNEYSEEEAAEDE